ncbi:MAG: hypothetical protein CMJ48_10070 [Planctomycetaceae bacterium]|nr:hypothetical protein [Planctomycetaceae bacterium]
MLDLSKQTLRIATNWSRLPWLRHRWRTRGRRNAVFVWIPKSAGTSIYSVLSRAGCPKFKNVDAVKYRFPQQGIVTFGHMSYAELVRAGHVSNQFDASALKFCFARNPYDRAVSLFSYLRKTGRLAERSSFLAFCRRLQEEGCDPVGLYNRRGLSLCSPQVRWLDDVEVDFVGRFESIASDFGSICDVLGIPRTSLPHLNGSNQRRYGESYCGESKRIVESFYAEDFESFGYAHEEFVECNSGSAASA